MEKNNLTVNQKQFLIEVFKRWGNNPILQDNIWQIRIGEEEVDDLFVQGYLVNDKHENGKLKFNLSIKGQEYAAASLKNSL